MKTLVITTLAEYQTVFWLEVASHVQSDDLDVAFISFDDRSSEQIASHGYQLLRISSPVESDKASADEVNALLDTLQIENPALYLSHERFSFGLRSSEEIHGRFYRYFNQISAFLKKISVGSDVVMMQELGGFVSVLASFEAAKVNEIDCFFIEPSFFKGRQFFLKNSLLPKSIKVGSVDSDFEPEVLEYIEKAISKKELVIPEKDKHHYSAAFLKVLKMGNVKRLLIKTYDKYILGKHHEFGYISYHVKRHISMALCSLRLKRVETPLNLVDKFVYFPLHVPGDVALTLRSPQFLDQLSLVDYLARNIPFGYQLAIKEHPAQLGAFGASRIEELLKRYDNLVLLDSRTNNFDVLDKASCIVSINSKSGAEAALIKKPVIVLGSAFYSDAPFVEKLDSLEGLCHSIKSSIDFHGFNCSQLPTFFNSLWGETFAGELYDCSSENVNSFKTSVLAALEK